MKRTIIYILFLAVISSQAWAQETIYSLDFNTSVATQYKNSLNDASRNYPDTIYLTLPFSDDFSTISVWPSPQKWADNYAYINTDYAKFPPTIGVATLDAIDEHGKLYSNAGPYPFDADKLTSQPFRLDSLFSPVKKAITRQDSPFLSFYYQPQGRGSMPSKKDSLILEFHSPVEIDTLYTPKDTTISPRWHTMWSTPGGVQVDTFAQQQNKYFRQVIIPIVDSALYYKKGFRFRFRNIASLASQNQPDWQSNGDQWNIDLVVLNTGHDTVFHDVAFADRAPSMLRKYEAMPYEQYKENWLLEMKDTVSILIANLDHTYQNIAYTYNVRKDSQLPFYTYLGNSYTIPPFYTDGYMTYQRFARPAVNFFYSPFENQEKIVFHTTHFLTTDPGLENQENDTIRYTQVFSNYYAYDDGTAEAGIGLNGAAGSYAVRFQLNKADNLRGIQLYLNQVRTGTNLQYIDFVIWNDHNGQPGQVIKRQRAITPVYADSLNIFHTYWFDTIVNIDPINFPGLIFYAGWQQTALDNLNVGFDRYNDSHTNRFYNVDGTWQMSDEQHAGSLMLRPVVGLADPLGIHQQASSLIMGIYPNPVTNGTVNIALPEAWSKEPAENVHLTLYNGSGSLINEAIYNSRPDVGYLTPGLYLLKLYNKTSGETTTGKMIVR